MSRDYTHEVPWLCSYIDELRDTSDRMDDYVLDTLNEVDDLESWISDIEDLFDTLSEQSSRTEPLICEGSGILEQVKEGLDEARRERETACSTAEYIRENVCKLRELAEEAYEMYASSQDNLNDLHGEYEALETEVENLRKRNRELESLLDPVQGKMQMFPFYHETRVKA